jgi:hypothetical protein
MLVKYLVTPLVVTFSAVMLLCYATYVRRTPKEFPCDPQRHLFLCE